MYVNINDYFTECPIGLTEKLFTKEYMDIASSFNSITGTNTYRELIEHKWYYKESNASGFYNRDEFYQKNERHKTDDQCIPRYRLVRIKRAETFSTVYLLQVISVLLRYPLRFFMHVIWNDWKLTLLKSLFMYSIFIVIRNNKSVLSLIFFRERNG